MKGTVISRLEKKRMKNKEIISLPLDKVLPDKENPRRAKEENEIKELADSIERNGQEEPIHIEKLNGKYLIIEGHRRFFALKILQERLGKPQMIDCIIRQTMSKEDRLLKRVVIDTQKRNWAIVDRDKAWKEIWDLKEWENTEFAKKIGTSKEQVRFFLERMNLKKNDPKLYKALENKSGLLQETQIIKGENRKKVLRYAIRENVGAMALRQLVKVLKDASDTLIDAFTKGDIGIDEVNKMKSLDAEKQEIGIHTIKGMHTKIKKVPKILSKSQIKDADPKIKTAHEFMEKLQDEILNTTNQLMTIEGVLETIEDKGYDQYFSQKMKEGLNACLVELEKSMKNTTAQVKRSMNEWEAKKIR